LAVVDRRWSNDQYLWMSLGAALLVPQAGQCACRAAEISTPVGCPDALRAFFDVVEDTPEWVDFDLINAGAKAYRSYGPNVRDVMPWSARRPRSSGASIFGATTDTGR